MYSANPDEKISVAAVIGREVRIYSELEKGATTRRLLWVMEFPHYGAAKLYADEYEERERQPQR